MRFKKVQQAQANLIRDASTIESLHKSILGEINELKSEGLVIDYWVDYEHGFKDHVETIKGMLTSSALVLEEKLDQERAALSKKKSDLNLT